MFYLVKLSKDVSKESNMKKFTFKTYKNFTPVKDQTRFYNVTNFELNTLINPEIELLFYYLISVLIFR